MATNTNTTITEPATAEQNTDTTNTLRDRDDEPPHSPPTRDELSLLWNGSSCRHRQVKRGVSQPSDCPPTKRDVGRMTISFIFCVCGVREQGGLGETSPRTPQTTRRDGSRSNHRRNRFRFRYRTTTTVYSLIERREEISLSHKECSSRRCS